MDKIEFLTNILGENKKGNRDYHMFYCPFCNHHNPKLGVSLNTGKFKCWVCEKKGSVLQLVTWLNKGTDIISKAKQLWKSGSYTIIPSNQKEIVLPLEYKPLWKPQQTFHYKRALQYIISERHLTVQDIVKHEIGYCDGGKYEGYIIFPHRDESSTLVYWSGRAFLPKQLKFILPPDVDKNVATDLHQIDWAEPIILCESKINQITIRRNAICMFGKKPSNKLHEVIFNHEVSEIYVVYDEDVTDTQVYEHMKKFVDEGITVYKVNIKSDCNEIGFEKTWEYIKIAKPISHTDIFQSELLSKFKNL